MKALSDNDKMHVVGGLILLGICTFLLILAIHIQIPDQSYCDDMFESRHKGALATVFYKESLTRYDHSLNQSKCVYDANGDFIANPKYSIWGLRL